MDRHTRAQCSHASVGLAQARPNESLLAQDTIPALLSCDRGLLAISHSLVLSKHSSGYYTHRYMCVHAYMIYTTLIYIWLYI